MGINHASCIFSPLVQRGLTALHDASSEGHTNIALLLLSMGANVMAQTKDGWTCLMSAASNGHLQLARILMAAGCDIGAQTKVNDFYTATRTASGLNAIISRCKF